MIIGSSASGSLARKCFSILLNNKIKVKFIPGERDNFKIKKEYDVVVTDFEPISAYAARKLGIHCIGIGHQYSFLKKIPKSFKMKLASLFFLRFYTPINSAISSHFYHFNQPILSPFIEESLKNKEGVSVMKNTFLVYLAWEEKDQMISILNTIKSNEFIYYCSVDKEEQIDNVTLKPYSNKKFKKDLVVCNGLLTNAGFQLPAEAIYLGKKTNDEFAREVIIKVLEGFKAGGELEDQTGISNAFNAIATFYPNYKELLGPNFVLPEAKAEGGRIGYKEGSFTAPTASVQTEASQTQDLTFTELRSRLPNSISDDIVTVLSNSKQALLDFANIRDQRDVEEFNQRYNLNLTIPQEG